MLLMTPQANPPLAAEASSVPEILPLTTLQGPGPRRSAKKQKQDDLINVCSSVCSVIIIAHGKALKVTQSTSLMLPPPLPVGLQVETAFPRGKGKGKGKAVVKGKVQGGGDDEDGGDERDDEAVDDPSSHKDNHDLSAQFIVQQAS
jgi:hypothetical protein